VVNHAAFLRTASCCLFLSICLTSLSCDEEDFDRSYPEGCTVGVYVDGISPDAAIGKEFGSWVIERLVTFSNEKKDFKVDTVLLKNPAEAPQTVSYILEIRFDSLNLLSYQKYKKDMKDISDAADNLDMIAASVMSHVAYNATERPALTVYLAVDDRTTMHRVWSYDKRIEIISNAAMQENEQLGQLLSAVKSLILDELAFFKLD
jgi:hypothetical protein